VAEALVLQWKFSIPQIEAGARVPLLMLIQDLLHGELRLEDVPLAGGGWHVAVFFERQFCLDRACLVEKDAFCGK